MIASIWINNRTYLLDLDGGECEMQDSVDLDKQQYILDLDTEIANEAAAVRRNLLPQSADISKKIRNCIPIICEVGNREEVFYTELL